MIDTSRERAREVGVPASVMKRRRPMVAKVRKIDGNPRHFAVAPDGDVAGWRSRLKELFGTAWREGQRTSADQGGGTLEEKINDILSHNGGYLGLKADGFTDAEIESVGYRLEGEGEARDIVVKEIDTKALEDKFDAIAKSEGYIFPKVAEIEALIDGPESKRALSDFLNGKIDFYERLLNALKWQRRPCQLDACMSELETLLVGGASDEDLKARATPTRIK